MNFKKILSFILIILILPIRSDADNFGDTGGGKIIYGDKELENIFDKTLNNYPSKVTIPLSKVYFDSLRTGKKLNKKLVNIYTKSNNKNRLKYSNNRTTISTKPFYPSDKVVEIVLEIRYPDLNGGYIYGDRLKYYENEAKKVADKFVNQEIINKNLSDEEKVLKIHDFIISNAEYSSDGLGSYNIEDHIPYGVLVKGKGVCESYAKAFSLIANKSGLENIYVTGRAYNGLNPDGEDHAWNMVKIGGAWYNIDTTWNDMGKDKIRYDYFLKSDKDIKKSHYKDKEFDYPEANGEENFIKKMGLNK